MTELSRIFGVSRQGAHDMIRRCEKILNGYEKRLALVSHYRKGKKMVKEIQQCAIDLKDCEDRDLLHAKAARIAQLSGDILEEY